MRLRYPEMSKALNASGRHIAFNMCEWGQKNPWEWGDACAQSWRATKDHTGQPPAYSTQLRRATHTAIQSVPVTCDSV